MAKSKARKPKKTKIKVPAKEFISASKQIAEPNKEIEEKERREALAEIYMSPSFKATNLILSLGNQEGFGFLDIIKELVNQSASFLEGNLKDAENMLFSQAKALEAIFYCYVDKMAKAEHMQQAQIYSDIALKAQKQARVALTTLMELKNPKQTAFIKQQNNAINQQVNNNNKVGKIENSKKKFANELLSEAQEVQYETLDATRACTPIPANTSMEAMETLHRRDNTPRESH